MNLSISILQPKSIALYLLGLAIALMIYWVAYTNQTAQARVSLPYHFSQIINGDSLARQDIPAPIPVPTPPAFQGKISATPIPPRAASIKSIPIPQPVPTPPERKP